MGFLGSLFAAKNSYQAPGDYLGSISHAVGQQNSVLGQQQGLSNLLNAQINGGGPNLAQTQLQAAVDRNNATGASLIGAQRGLNPQLAARQILQNNAMNNQGAANQSAQLRQQQQLGAQEQLAGVLGQQGSLASSQLGALGSMQQGNNALNAQVAGQNQQAANSFFPSVLGGISGLGQAATSIGHMFSEGGQVPALVSPGEMIIPPGGKVADGGIVPGQAKVKGDSQQNDTVRTSLTPGSIVVPRSKVNSPDPQAVANFVSALRGEGGMMGYGKVVDAKKKWKGGKI